MEDRKSAALERWKGAGGAVLGALLGIALWILMDAMSYLVFLAGAAVPFFTGRGYMLASVHIDRKSFCISLCISFAALIAAFFLSKDILFALAQAREGWAMDYAGIAANTLQIALADGAGQLVKDGLFSLAFFALGQLDFINVLGDSGVRLFGKKEAATNS